MNDLLSIKQTARCLNLAPITIYKMVSAKRIPYCKVGRRVLFDPHKLEEWVSKKSVKPIGGSNGR